MKVGEDMQIQFGTSSKRVNSTFIPAMSRTYNCTLKRPCTIETPVVDISDFNINYNVAYIPDFGRYYFVSNIESVSNSITRYYLTVDALASFKAVILNNVLNVSRSQSHGDNMQIDDLATHTAGTPTVTQTSYSIPDYNAATGIYVLQIAGPKPSNSIGESVSTYVLTASELRSLIEDLFTASTYNDAGTVTVSGETKTYFNPFQYILSCKWFPIDYTYFSYHLTTGIKFGWWESDVVGHLLQDYMYSSNVTIQLPAASDWTYCAPGYSRYSIAVPGMGLLEIDPVYAGNTITVQFFVDMLTGGAKCEIYLTQNGANKLISSANGYWCTDVLLTQLASDANNLASNAIHTASEGLFGMDFGSAITASMTQSAGASANQAAGDLAFSMGLMESIPFVGSAFKKARDNMLQPALSASGAVGNMTELKVNGNVRFINRHYSMIEPDLNAVIGKPCNRNYRLSTLSGYTQCNNASITVAGATIKEKLAIKSYLEGGFWIE